MAPNQLWEPRGFSLGHPPRSAAVIGRRMIATYRSAHTTPIPAAVISAGTKDPLACTMNPVTAAMHFEP